MEKNKLLVRLRKIEKIVIKLYEDLIEENLSSSNYQNMLDKYQEEQKEINNRLNEIEDKFAQIRKVVKRKIYDSDYVQNKSIIKLRKAIGLAPDISVLEKYGVKVDKTVLADW